MILRGAGAVKFLFFLCATFTAVFVLYVSCCIRENHLVISHLRKEEMKKRKETVGPPVGEKKRKR